MPIELKAETKCGFHLHLRKFKGNVSIYKPRQRRFVRMIV